MTIRNMTPQRILKKLDGIGQVHCLIEQNCVTVQVKDEGGWVDVDATDEKANEVWNALGAGWMWRGTTGLVRLSYDPHGELSRAHDAAMRDQLGPAYEPA